MKAKVLCLMVFVSAAISFGWNSMIWQTTHNGTWNGNCRLESNSMNVTISPLHLDIEEEAVIVTEGSVGWGDSRTLEIVGEFSTIPGTAIRSMLLWNGNTVLKAKLRDKKAADSLYEAVVDRSKPQPIVRDPAIIEQLSPNRYRFRIYPVEINKSRRIRILYSVPLQAYSEGPRFDILAAFSAGSAYYPDLVSLTINRGETPTGRYTLNWGNTKRQLQFGSTYRLPSSDLRQYTYYYSTSREPRQFSIVPDSSSQNRAYVHTVSQGPKTGIYTAVFASVPDSVITALQYNQLGFDNIEARIATGVKSYITNVPYAGSIGIYMKTTAAWDKKIYWYVYDYNGTPVYEYTQQIVTDTSSTYTNMLPLFWASKYTLDQGNKSLGGVYGFVDSRMSLLALESDSLPKAAGDMLDESGVPPLTDNEIILAASDLPNPPATDIYFEIHDNTAADSKNSGIKENRLIQLPNDLIEVQLKNGSITMLKVALYDLQGRLVAEWAVNGTAGRAIRFAIPYKCKGRYLMKVSANREIITGKIILR